MNNRVLIKYFSLAFLLLPLMIFVTFSRYVQAAGNTVLAEYKNGTVNLQIEIEKNSTGSYQTLDKDCDHISLVIFDLSAMGPISDITVVELTMEQKKANTVKMNVSMKILDGFKINPSEIGRYVLMGSFERSTRLGGIQEPGSQFSVVLDFGKNVSVPDGDDHVITQINREGRIIVDQAELTAGIWDTTPAVGEDGLWLKLNADEVVYVKYKQKSKYYIEHNGKYYYTNEKNVAFESSAKESLTENIRRSIQNQSMLKEFYLYGVSDFAHEIISGNHSLSNVIQVTREELMNSSDTVELAFKNYLKAVKKDGTTSGQVVDPYVDAIIDEDPMRSIGEAVNDIMSDGKTKAIRDRDKELESQGKEEIEAYEKEHAKDQVALEIDRQLVGELLRYIWNVHLADSIINAEPDKYGSQLSDIYSNILGWNHNFPQNYETLVECYTGNPAFENGYQTFSMYGSNSASYSSKGKSQAQAVRNSAMSDQFRSYISDGKLTELPFNYQTMDASSYNRYLPGSLVMFEIWDYQLFFNSTKRFLGVYVGDGKFVLPDYDDSKFDVICNLPGVDRHSGYIWITQSADSRPFGKKQSYGFLNFCYSTIYVTNIYELDLAIFNDPRYIDGTYFPDMDAETMSRIRYDEIAWQLENNWPVPMVSVG